MSSVCLLVLCIIVSLSPPQPDIRASNYHLKTDGKVASRQITVSLRKRHPLEGFGLSATFFEENVILQSEWW